jgi:hypothetical protein
MMNKRLTNAVSIRIDLERFFCVELELGLAGIKQNRIIN